MTEQDKKLIVKYMGWVEVATEDVMSGKLSTQLIKKDSSFVKFDACDASVVVKEMFKRNDWEDFHDFVVSIDELSRTSFTYVAAWLFDSNNFFTAMTKWLGEK